MPGQVGCYFLQPMPLPAVTFTLFGKYGMLEIHRNVPVDWVWAHS